jgi:hypothetical protein
MNNSYLSKSIRKFIQENEKMNNSYNPKIKIIGTESETKYLDVSYNTLRKLAEIGREE